MDPIFNWITVAASDTSSQLMLIGLDLINQPTMTSMPSFTISGSQ